MKKITMLLEACALALVATNAYAQGGSKEKEKEQKEETIDPKKQLVWVDAQGGFESANLSTFAANFDTFSVGVLPRSATGPAASFGAGIRLWFLTLGARGRVASFQGGDPANRIGGWTMSSLDGELGFRIPLGRLEPYLAFAGGYTTLGGLGDAVQGAEQGISVNGANARASLGLDYFLSKYFSVGLTGSGEVLALTRPGVPLRDVAALPQSQTLGVAARRAIEANGTTWGTAIALTGGLSAHF